LHENQNEILIFNFQFSILNLLIIFASMNREEAEALLKKRHIQPTAIRLLVLKALSESKQSLSLLDLDNLLDTVDKSSIFRTLTLFHAHRVVHGIDDGTGSYKYALCDADCTCELDGEHTHFHCMECHRTFCFKNIPTPLVHLPEGFQLTSVNYVVTGVCAQCTQKHHTNS